jgi:excisionase family DNA binding protein
MDLAPKLVYSRAEAAETLKICVSSLDVLIATGRLKAARKGRRVLIHVTEIERLAAKEIPQIWPSRHERRKTEISPSDLPQMGLEI